MNEKKKTILLAVLAVGVISMTIVYAALSSTLNINGSARVQNIDSSWNIHFAHITDTQNEVKTYEYATTTGTLDLSNSNTTVTVPEVTLKAPGDKVEYRFKVVNEGEITGYINVLNNIGIGTITYGAGEQLTSEQKTAFQNDIQVTLTYNNPVSLLAYNDSLAKNEEKELILTIQYIKRETTQYLPTTDVTFTNITASITYGQSTTNLSGNGTSPNSPTVVQPTAKPTMAQMCPGCVYGKNTDEQYIGDELTVETTNDYTSLGNYFLGYILNGNTVEREFACGIENGEYFCLEGYDTSKYSNNIDILNHFFDWDSQCAENSSDSRANCNGSSVNAYAYDDGDVSVRKSGYYCYVYYGGSAYCN